MKLLAVALRERYSTQIWSKLKPALLQSSHGKKGQENFQKARQRSCRGISKSRRKDAYPEKSLTSFFAFSLFLMRIARVKHVALLAAVVAAGAVEEHRAPVLAPTPLGQHDSSGRALRASKGSSSSSSSSKKSGSSSKSCKGKTKTACRASGNETAECREEEKKCETGSPIIAIILPTIVAVWIVIFCFKRRRQQQVSPATVMAEPLPVVNAVQQGVLMTAQQPGVPQQTVMPPLSGNQQGYVVQPGTYTMPQASMVQPKY